MMSKRQIYQAYLSWLGCSPVAVPFEHLLNFPVTSFDVSEDDKQVVSRLVYFVPDFSGHSPRSFFFFEENTFSKDDCGDLDLIHSSFQLFGS